MSNVHYIIADLDGCLADDRHRRNLIALDAPNNDQKYASYHLRCSMDRPNPEAVSFLQRKINEWKFANGGKLELIVLTARPVVLENECIEWVRNNTNIGFDNFYVVCRATNNHAPSPIVKIEQLKALAATLPFGLNAEGNLSTDFLSKIILAIDDRQDVLEAYNNLGLFTQRIHLDDEQPQFTDVRSPLFSEHVARLKKRPELILAGVKEEDRDKVDAWHMGACVMEEAGELFEPLKKWIIYGKLLDVDQVIKEMGDMEFYLEGLRQALGIKRSDVIKANIEKLSKRYPSGKFTDKDAIDRVDTKEGA